MPASHPHRSGNRDTSGRFVGRLAVGLLACSVSGGGCAFHPSPHALGGGSATGNGGNGTPSLAIRTSAPAARAEPDDRPALDGGERSDDAKARASFEAVSRALGRPGVYKTAGVYVVTVPRDDLLLAIEGMEVPTAAGIESVFHFYYCPCGKTNVVGQLCVLDYEQNDVIDALRGGRIEVVSVAPMLLHARNAPTAVRFFAEGKPEAIGAALREALRWTGKERMAPAAE